MQDLQRVVYACSVRNTRASTMPTLTLSRETLEHIGLRRAHLVPTFTIEGRGLVETLLASRGFDMTRAIRVVELASGEGFVFTQ